MSTFSEHPRGISKTCHKEKANYVQGDFKITERYLNTLGRLLAG
jgi:hypothetical protein